MVARTPTTHLSQSPLSLDHQATTPCAPEVVEAMAPYWEQHWGNPSSRQHRLGLSASAAVNLARQQLIKSLALRHSSLVFTSGATEANNLALLGRARHHGRSGHLISVSTEHHAVLDPLRQLQREGFRVTLLSPGSDGLVTADQLRTALEPDTFLVSVMAANNEIGVLQPLQALGALCRERGISFHSDAAQAFGNVPLAPECLGLDLVSLSAHKIYGPKGIGALVIRDGERLSPLLWGGGQQDGLRPGTLPTPLIVGFAAAASLAVSDLEQSRSHRSRLRNKLWEGLQKRLPTVLLNGAEEPRLPHNLNITLPGLNGRRLHQALRSKLICSSGSACSRGEPSHVLQALGRSRADAEASLRLSLGRDTTETEIDQTIELISEVASALQ